MKNYRRGDIGRFLVTRTKLAERTKKLAETINPMETKISEPKEQIKAWLRSLPGSMSAWSKRDEAMRDAIRSLIENMDKKVQDDIFIKHIQSHLRPGQKVICKICGKNVETIVKEKGHEVEEKERGGDKGKDRKAN